MRKKPLVTAILALAALSGCQTPMQTAALKQSQFALGMSDVGTPVEASAASTPHGAGQLTVKFQGELAGWQGRKVLATVTDVDHVVVAVTAADGAEFSQTVDKAAIAGGTTSVTFSALAIGHATVTITAYDAAGHVLGVTAKPADVTAGQTATVEVALQLSPTYVPSGGSGGTAATGGLMANVSILDGPVIQGTAGNTGTLQASAEVGKWSSLLAVDSGGNAWVGGWTYHDLDDGSMSLTGRLSLVSSDGAVLKQVDLKGPAEDIARDSQGNVWVLQSSNGHGSTGFLTCIAPDASIVGEYPLDVAASGLAIDALDNLWIVNQQAQWVSRVPKAQLQAGKKADAAAPNGTAAMQVRVDGAVAVVPDGQGAAWVLGSALVKLAPDGTVAKTIVAPHGGPQVDNSFPGCITLDKSGDLWAVLTDGQLLKFKADGTPLGQWSGYGASANTPIQQWSNQLLVPDPSGGVWARTKTSVVRLDANGNVLATFGVPKATVAGGMAIGSTGLWVTNGNSDVYRFAP